jgi:hypothetical protein
MGCRPIMRRHVRSDILMMVNSPASRREVRSGDHLIKHHRALDGVSCAWADPGGLDGVHQAMESLDGGTAQLVESTRDPAHPPVVAHLGDEHGDQFVEYSGCGGLLCGGLLHGGLLLCGSLMPPYCRASFARVRGRMERAFPDIAAGRAVAACGARARLVALLVYRAKCAKGPQRIPVQAFQTHAQPAADDAQTYSIPSPCSGVRRQSSYCSPQLIRCRCFSRRSNSWPISSW